MTSSQNAMQLPSQHAIMNDGVEEAPIYRCGGMVERPRRSCKKYDLCIEQEAARPVSHCKQAALSNGVPITGLLAPKPNSWEHSSTNGLL